MPRDRVTGVVDENGGLVMGARAPGQFLRYSEFSSVFNAATDLSTRPRRVINRFCNAAESRPLIHRDGALNDDALRILAALEYMYYSLKPCVRRMNALWNRRFRLQRARLLRERVSPGTTYSRGGERLCEDTNRQFSSFQDVNTEANEEWSSRVYSDYGEALQAIPSTGFNWAAFFGSEVPREVRNVATDTQDESDLDMVGYRGLYRRGDDE